VWCRGRGGGEGAGRAGGGREIERARARARTRERGGWRGGRERPGVAVAPRSFFVFA
jgi:hypothetical protein